MVSKTLWIALLLWMGALTGGAQQVKPLDIHLTNFTYPYPVRFIRFQIQGESLRMAYMDVKPTQPNGKTVLLLHGKNFNGAYWQQTAEALSQRGFRVVMPDQIGFGKSTKPRNLQYSFQLLAFHTRALLDTLQVDRVAVLGHSMGGMLATRFALMYPDRVDKLILENPIGLEDWKRMVPYQPPSAAYQQELGQTYTRIKQYQLENYYGGQWKPEYDKWAALLAGWTLDVNYPRVAWNAALTSEMIFTQPVLYEFEDLRVPTLLIIGQRDRTAIGKNLVPKEIAVTMGNYPKLGKLTAAQIKTSQLVELDNIGHLPHIEAFSQFIIPLLDFLNK
jgi:pimeloyl-ACP methyl ester carboxylesterase